MLAGGVGKNPGKTRDFRGFSFVIMHHLNICHIINFPADRPKSAAPIYVFKVQKKSFIK